MGLSVGDGWVGRRVGLGTVGFQVGLGTGARDGARVGRQSLGTGSVHRAGSTICLE